MRSRPLDTLWEWTSHVPRKAMTRRKFTLPSWWLGLAPGRPASFWVSVERARLEAGVSRSDRDGIAHIIRTLPSRKGRTTHHQGARHENRK